MSPQITFVGQFNEFLYFTCPQQGWLVRVLEDDLLTSHCEYAGFHDIAHCGSAEFVCGLWDASRLSDCSVDSNGGVVRISRKGESEATLPIQEINFMPLTGRRHVQE